MSPGAFARRPGACAPLVSVARVRARGRTSAASACDELPLRAAAQPSSDARRGFIPGLRNRRDWTLILDRAHAIDRPMKWRAVPMNVRTRFRFLSLSKGHLGQRQFFPLSHTRRSERVRVRPWVRPHRARRCRTRRRPRASYAVGGVTRARTGSVGGKRPSHRVGARFAGKGRGVRNHGKRHRAVLGSRRKNRARCSRETARAGRSRWG